MNPFERGDIEGAKKLLEWFFDIDLNYDGKPPLLLAIQAKQKIMCDYLLKQGANPNLEYNDKPILYYVCELQEEKLLELLLLYQVDTTLLYTYAIQFKWEWLINYCKNHFLCCYSIETLLYMIGTFDTLNKKLFPICF
jgi:hypothetical protein